MAFDPVGGARAAVLVAAVGLALAGAADGRAATITVSTTEQLQQAVEGARDGDEIVLQPSPQAYAPTAPLAVGARITIRGTGDGPVTLSGTGLDGARDSWIVAVERGATLTLSDLTVQTGAVDAAAIAVDGSLLLESATVAGNSGPGVVVQPEASAVVRNSTLSDNLDIGIVVMGKARFESSTVAGNGLYGVYSADGGVVELVNTIVADNGAALPDKGSDCDVPVSSTATSLDGDGSCGVGALSASNPRLAPLADNGGATRTRSLAAGSPAIDAGAGCPGTDQRRAARPGACDIGAFESGASAPARPSGGGAQGSAGAPSPALGTPSATPRTDPGSAPKTPPTARAKARAMVEVKASASLVGRKGKGTLRLTGRSSSPASARLQLVDSAAGLSLSRLSVTSFTYDARTSTMTLKGLARNGARGTAKRITITIVDRARGDILTVRVGTDYVRRATIASSSLSLAV